MKRPNPTKDHPATPPAVSGKKCNPKRMTPDQQWDGRLVRRQDHAAITGHGDALKMTGVQLIESIEHLVKLYDVLKAKGYARLTLRGGLEVWEKDEHIVILRGSIGGGNLLPESHGVRILYANCELTLEGCKGPLLP